jgi:hypothetical protein
MLDYAKNIIIFEADDKWIAPLTRTFENYKNNIRIITKYASDTIGGGYTRLDDELKANSKIDLIKMDVEGAEISVINGAKNTLKCNPQAVILACAYHYDGEEKDIRELMSDYTIIPRHGYVLYHWPVYETLKKPFMRRGVLEIRKTIDTEGNTYVEA